MTESYYAAIDSNFKGLKAGLRKALPGLTNHGFRWWKGKPEKKSYFLCADLGCRLTHGSGHWPTDTEKVPHPTYHTLPCSTVAAMSSPTIGLLHHPCKSVRDWKFQKILKNYSPTWFSAVKGMGYKIDCSLKSEAKNSYLRTNKNIIPGNSNIIALTWQRQTSKLDRMHHFPKIMLSSVASVNNNARMWTHEI